MTKIKLILRGRPIWLYWVSMAVVLIVGMMIPVSPQFRGPLVDINDGIMLAVLVAFGAFVAQLWLRVGKLETDVEKFKTENDSLRADLAAAASFINRVGFWIEQGMPANRRPKPPKQLEEHGVDVEPWDEPAIGGTDD